VLGVFIHSIPTVLYDGRLDNFLPEMVNLRIFIGTFIGNGMKA